MTSAFRKQGQNMYGVLGATGHVGRAVANTLLAAGQSVTVVTRNPQKAQAWRQKGASAAVVDVLDTPALAAVFKTVTRAFLLNPPANVASDTDTEERRSVQSILAALEGVSLEKIVLQSTYGAQPGPHCGDLGVLHEFEERARALGTPLCCVRAAYYMSNWVPLAKQAKETGVFSTVLPVDQKVPMVAPDDVGVLGAQLLMSPVEETGLYACEGPHTYSPRDVAAAFTQVFGRAIQATSVPKADWLAYYRQNGFSQRAARSYAHMTELFLEQPYDHSAPLHKGPTDLEAYFRSVFTG
nr:NmrA family NAD(P)-binding protein [Acetobacter senegalensis]